MGNLQCGPVVWSSGEPAVWTCSVEQCGAYNGEPAVWTCSVEQCGAYNGEPAVWNLQRGACSVDLQGGAASVE